MSSFEDSIKEKLKAKKLSDSSINLYLRNLRRLNGGAELKDFKFLNKIDNVLKQLSDLKPNTRKGYLISIVSTLNCFLDTKPMQVLTSKYYKLMIDEAKAISDTPTSVMSREQSDNWMTFENVKKEWEALHEKVKALTKPITETKYNLVLQYMVLSLYVKTKPRRNQDYQLMNIKRDVGSKEPQDVNYLGYDNNKFIFNVFKTKGKFNQQTIDIPPELKECITTYLKFHPLLKNGKLNKDTNVKFLVYFDGSELKASNSITRILNKIFHKKIGSSLLRHIFLSDAYGEADAEREKTAEEMGHSGAMSRAYVKDESQKKGGSKKIELPDVVITFD